MLYFTELTAEREFIYFSIGNVNMTLETTFSLSHTISLKIKLEFLQSVVYVQGYKKERSKSCDTEDTCVYFYGLRVPA